MPIELNANERELLIGLLEREFEEIRTEIHHTKNHEYKETLKEKENSVQLLLARLKS